MKEYTVKEKIKFGRMPEAALLVNENKLHYPASPPFSPDQRYPEYPFDHVSHEANLVYESIRHMFMSLGYDEENFGKRSWNPLKHFVSPGQKIVIKPNWVLQHNITTKSHSAIITHSSVIRAVLDYAIIALKGKGKIIIGDAPIQGADFSQIVQNSQADKIVSFLKKHTDIQIGIEDFRREITVRKDGVVIKRIFQNDNNYLKINLKQESCLSLISKFYEDFRVTNYDKDMMKKYHNPRDHIYVINKNVLDADVVISIPKLKSHRKAGLTCCLKNSIGINCQKDCLPHHRIRSIEEGGDAYEKASRLKRTKELVAEKFDKADTIVEQLFFKFLFKILNKLFQVFSIEKDIEGSWYGNDTIWRTILDINKIFFYSNSKGELCNKQQRKLLYIVDGIIAGEGEGPLDPTDRHLGLLAAGENPLAVDLVISKVVGFDYKKILYLSRAVEDSVFFGGKFIPEKISVKLNSDDSFMLKDIDINLGLEPSAGWKGHIECV